MGEVRFYEGDGCSRRVNFWVLAQRIVFLVSRAKAKVRVWDSTAL